MLNARTIKSAMEINLTRTFDNFYKNNSGKFLKKEICYRIVALISSLIAAYFNNNLEDIFFAFGGEYLTGKSISYWQVLNNPTTSCDSDAEASNNHIQETIE